MKYLVDTTIFIRHLRGDKLAKEFLLAHSNDIVVSYVTAGELWQGAKSKKHQKQVETLLGASSIIWLDKKIQETALQILVNWAPRGVCLADALIAATALQQNFALVTDNTKHFKMISDLKVITPS